MTQDKRPLSSSSSSQTLPPEISHLAQTSSLGKMLTDYTLAPRKVTLRRVAGLILTFCLIIVGLMLLFLTTHDDLSFGDHLISSTILALLLCAAWIVILVREAWHGIYLLHVYICDHGFIYAQKHRSPKPFHWEKIQVWRSVTRYYRYKVYSGTSYAYTIRSQDGHQVKLANPLDVQRVGEIICNEVTKRLFPQAIQSYHAGQTLRFGPLSLSQQGIVHGFFTLAWTDVASITVQNGFIVIMSRQSRRFTWAKVAFSKIPNGFIFLALVDSLLKSDGKC
ncbi:DUF6585 family protein [Ktedonobacter racemifer]|uniref:Uncharacterized protein n=1 Tax=Ktedonobacter racemifer DSM 44963 TaxID=485913 RepID=D6TDF0_KTERA|nr:DUF6585 family protein [Ktedonobacter racemifer]EFH88295.1 hypothetical protein Krac_9722 [Ktedonobacter racemifer DSM 44963]